MALTHSSKVATDGLVFYYDMANIQKSFTGPPTTNLNSSLTYTQSWNNSGLATWSADDQSIPRLFSNHPVSSMTKDTEGNSHIGLGNAVLSTSTTYAVSIYCYIPSNNGLALTGTVPYMRTFPSNISKGGLTYNGNSDWNQWPRNTWVRSTGTFFNGTDTSMYISCYLNTATNKIGFTAPQFEAQSFATTYVNGTRSSTQALRDLTGRNTVTTNSLTYDSNEIFRFNGISDYINLGTSIQLSDNLSLSVWHKNPNTGFIVDQGDIGTDPNGCLEWTNYGLSLASNNLSGVIDSTTVSSLNTAQWNNVVCTFKSGQVNFYLNGNLTLTTTTSFTSFSPQGHILKIGRRAFSTSSIFSGTIGAVQIYNNKILTADEVRQNFNALRGRYGI